MSLLVNGVAVLGPGAASVSLLLMMNRGWAVSVRKTHSADCTSRKNKKDSVEDDTPR